MCISPKYKKLYRSVLNYHYSCCNIRARSCLRTRCNCYLYLEIHIECITMVDSSGAASSRLRHTSANFSFIQFFNRTLSYSADGILPRICIYSPSYLRTSNATHRCTFTRHFYHVNVLVIVTVEVYSRCWHIYLIAIPRALLYHCTSPNFYNMYYNDCSMKQQL